MKDLSTVQHNQTLEQLVQILCQKTQNTNPLFFRVLVAYYFTKVASMMRCSVNTHDRGLIPVNMYAINLAASGHGKGYSTNIVEEEVISGFKERFLDETYPIMAEKQLLSIANKRAAKKSTDPDEELERVTREFDNLGPLMFSFDSGTAPAVKQMRHQLLMANAGSMNMEIDEVGSNFVGQLEVLNTFLELYDVGKIKQKLIKNTADNTRNEQIDGRTPTNMMLFGTPSKLMNGSKTEEEFISMLETGYARRCFFGYIKGDARAVGLTAEQLYDQLTNNNSEQFITQLHGQFTQLADIINYGRPLDMTKEVTIELLQYKLDCEYKAHELPEHEEIRKAELSHRYFKSLKLAGTFAFIEGHHEVTSEHLWQAIKLAEESGEAFDRLLTRDKLHVKLAKYIATANRELTHPELADELPFYKGSASVKSDLMNYAIAYGYKNNIVIKKYYQDGIEFLRGESLQETDINKLIVAYSTDYAKGYVPQKAPFDQLHKLTQNNGLHWTNHYMDGQHRLEANAIPGCNMIVLDVDDGTPISTAKLLLQEYTYLLYTTKSHTEAHNRYRIILPISHVLKLDGEEFREFMKNIFEWLPFEVDEVTGQRSRKWASHNGDHWYNDGQLLDALQFIPKTTKNEQRKQIIADQQSLTNIERWFVNNTGSGNRNQQLIKYALLLVDSGMTFDHVRNSVMAFNAKLDEPLPENEILSTIMQSTAKAIAARDNS